MKNFFIMIMPQVGSHTKNGSTGCKTKINGIIGGLNDNLYCRY